MIAMGKVWHWGLICVTNVSIGTGSQSAWPAWPRPLGTTLDSSSKRIRWISYLGQGPFQGPKWELSTIYEAYIYGSIPAKYGPTWYSTSTLGSWYSPWLDVKWGISPKGFDISLWKLHACRVPEWCIHNHLPTDEGAFNVLSKKRWCWCYVSAQILSVMCFFLHIRCQVCNMFWLVVWNMFAANPTFNRAWNCPSSARCCDDHRKISWS